MDGSVPTRPRAYPAQEQQGDSNRVGHAHGVPHVVYERERDAPPASVTTKTQRKTASAPSQALPVEGCVPWGRWQLDQLPAQGLVVRSIQRSRDHRRQRTRDRAVRLLWRGGLLQRPEARILRPCSPRQPMRYRIPSMMPQAMLHPSAPMSIAPTSSRPAFTTLSEPVNVRTMIRPKSASEMRSPGSRIRGESVFTRPGGARGSLGRSRAQP